MILDPYRGTSVRGSGVLPTHVANGILGVANGLGSTLSVAWAAGAVGDIGILVVATRVNITAATPAGFTLLRNFTIDGGSNNGANVYVFWKIGEVSDNIVNITLSNTALAVGQIMMFRNTFIDAINGPFDQVQTTSTGSVGAEVPFANLDCVETNTRVILVAAKGGAGYPWFSGLTLAGNLTSWNEVQDTGFSSGSGGAVVWGYATHSGNGPIGVVTGTSSGQIYASLACNIFG